MHQKLKKKAIVLVLLNLVHAEDSSRVNSSGVLRIYQRLKRKAIAREQRPGYTACACGVEKNAREHAQRKAYPINLSQNTYSSTAKLSANARKPPELSRRGIIPFNPLLVPRKVEGFRGGGYSAARGGARRGAQA